LNHQITIILKFYFKKPKTWSNSTCDQKFGKERYKISSKLVRPIFFFYAYKTDF